MLVNFAVLLILAAVVILFAWLARRAWRSRSATVPHCAVNETPVVNVMSG